MESLCCPLQAICQGRKLLQLLYLEIYVVSIESLNQVVIETDRETYSLSLTSVEDIKAMVSNVTASMKKIIPDSSPGKILKKIPPDLQERMWNLATREASQRQMLLYVTSMSSPAGRSNRMLTFTMPRIVWNLFFNQWFTKISNKDLKLSSEVQEQVLFMINRSSTLEEVCLEGGGLNLPSSCWNFALKTACGLRDHTCSAIHTINLSANYIENKGLANLTQGFSQNKDFASSLCHLDLSGNTGSLATEEAVVRVGATQAVWLQKRLW